ncbi:MAG TPA: hypothetical protein VIK18_18800, partial [Pirellulales bacterium]
MPRFLWMVALATTLLACRPTLAPAAAGDDDSNKREVQKLENQMEQLQAQIRVLQSRLDKSAASPSETRTADRQPERRDGNRGHKGPPAPPPPGDRGPRDADHRDGGHREHGQRDH